MITSIKLVSFNYSGFFYAHACVKNLKNNNSNQNPQWWKLLHVKINQVYLIGVYFFSTLSPHVRTRGMLLPAADLFCKVFSV